MSNTASFSNNVAKYLSGRNNPNNMLRQADRIYSHLGSTGKLIANDNTIRAKAQRSYGKAKQLQKDAARMIHENRYSRSVPTTNPLYR